MIVALTDAEVTALAAVIEARYENIVETRQQTGDDEYDQAAEDEAEAWMFELLDFTADTLDLELCPNPDQLHEAIWVALDTPEAFPELDVEALRSAASKVGYAEP